MSDRERGAPLARALIVAAAFVIVVAGMQAAQQIVVPFLMAAFLAVLCGPPIAWLQRKRLPHGAALSVVLLGMVALGGAVMAVAWGSIRRLVDRLPSYSERLGERFELLKQQLSHWHLPFLGDQVPGSTSDVQQLLQAVDPGHALDVVGSFAGQLGSLFANAFLILLLVIFLLVEAGNIRDRVGRGSEDPSAALQRFDRALAEINRYMGLKTLVSLVTGAVLAAWLALLGIDFPLLWGLLAFLLNFVPSLGSVLAAVPPMLLGFVAEGSAKAGGVAIAYAVVNVLVGSVLEPRLMGRGLGLSTLVVFLSLVCWGWVLGPVGMILSVPLTMIVKIALESRPEGRSWASWLGPPRAGGGAR